LLKKPSPKSQYDVNAFPVLIEEFPVNETILEQVSSANVKSGYSIVFEIVEIRGNPQPVTEVRLQ